MKFRSKSTDTNKLLKDETQAKDDWLKEKERVKDVERLDDDSSNLAETHNTDGENEDSATKSMPTSLFESE